MDTLKSLNINVINRDPSALKDKILDLLSKTSLVRLFPNSVRKVEESLTTLFDSVANTPDELLQNSFIKLKESLKFLLNEISLYSKGEKTSKVIEKSKMSALPLLNLPNIDWQLVVGSIFFLVLLGLNEKIFGGGNKDRYGDK